MSTRLASLQLALAHPARFALTASSRSSSCRAGARLAPRRYASNRSPNMGAAGKSRTKLKPPSSEPRKPVLTASHLRATLDSKYREFEKLIPQAKSSEIFTAPGHRGYIISCYAVGLCAYVYAAYNSYIHFVDPLGDVGAWIKYLFGGVCVVAGATGTVFLLRSKGLVSKITAMRTADGLKLHLTIRRPIPFQKPREVVVSPKDLSFSHGLVSPEHGAAKEAWEAARKQMAEHKRIANTPFYRAPMAKTSFLMWKGFSSVRKAFTQEGFIYLTVAGGKSNDLRLDTSEGVSQEIELLSQARR